MIESEEEKINMCSEPEDNRGDTGMLFWHPILSVNSYHCLTASFLCLLDQPYIFLPPCQYIFHGAELTYSQSPSFSKDDSTDSSQTDESLSDNSDQLEDDEDANVDPELSWNRSIEETQSPEVSALEKDHFTDQHNNSDTKIHTRI